MLLPHPILHGNQLCKAGLEGALQTRYEYSDSELTAITAARTFCQGGVQARHTFGRVSACFVLAFGCLLAVVLSAMYLHLVISRPYVGVTLSTALRSPAGRVTCFCGRWSRSSTLVSIPTRTLVRIWHAVRLGRFLHSLFEGCSIGDQVVTATELITIWCSIASSCFLSSELTVCDSETA